VLDARINESKAQCLINAKRLALAVQAYSVRSGGILPDAATWSDRLCPYLGHPDTQADLACPGAGTAPSLLPRIGPFFSSRADSYRCGYAFNCSISGLALPTEQQLQHTVVIFESDAGWNAAGGPELLPDEPRHLGGDNYAFADGHAHWLRRKKLPDGTWAKEPDADWVIWKPVLKEPEQVADD
jgi:prepilin-type processing-associated H-X9-DG protein